jgi:flotillin
MLWTIGIPVGIVLAFFVVILMILNRCDSDKIMVKSGAFCGPDGCRIYLGGITTIIPLLQSVRFMSREPLSIQINMDEAISKNKIRVKVPCNFQVALSEEKDQLRKSAARIVAMSIDEIKEKVSEILTGGLRVVIAKLTIEEINDDRNAFVDQVDTQVTEELAKLGFEITNVNIEEIDDEAGYLKALGQKAASAALNKANVEVAEQDKMGQIGVKTNETQRDIEIANQDTAKSIGAAEAQKKKDIRVAEMESQTATSKLEFEKEKINAQAALAVESSDAAKRKEVAQSKAKQALLEEQKKEEVLKLEKEVLAKQEIEKQKVTLEAEAKAEARLIEARAAAEGIKMKADAEAAGVRTVLEAQAEGYQKLFAQANPEAILAFEQLKITESLETIRAGALSQLRIDEVKIIDSGKGEGIGGFVESFVNAFPKAHAIGEVTGIKLPEFMGTNTAESEPAKETEVLDELETKLNERGANQSTTSPDLSEIDEAE